MLGPLTFAGAAVAAGAVALSTAAAGRRAWGGSRGLAALSVLAGTAAGGWLVGGLSPLPPRVAVVRLLVVGLPLAAATEAVAAGQRLRRLAPVVRGVAALVIVRVLLHDSVHLQMEATAGRTAVLGAAALAALAWPFVAAGERRIDGGIVAVVAVMVSLLAAALAIPMAGYVKGGLVAALLAVAVTGSLAGGGRSGLSGFGFAALMGIVVVGRFFGGLSSPAAVLLCMPPVLTVAAGHVGDLLGDEAAGRVIRSAAYRLAVAIVPLVVVLAQSWTDFDSSFRRMVVPPSGLDASPASSLSRENSR